MRTSISVLCLVILSFLLGYVRDLLIAWKYGGTWMADSLFVALLLPMFFENLSGIALKDAVLPHLYALRQQGLNVLRKQFRRLQFSVWAIGMGLTLVVALGAPLWLKLLMPGWENERINEFMWVFQLASILIFAQSVLYFQTAVFNSEGYFVLPMTRTVLFNIGAIIAMLLVETNIALVVMGILITQLLLLVVMQIILKKACLVHTTVDSASPLDRTSLARYLMPLLAIAFTQQLCFVVERILCSYMQEGSIAQLSYAFRIATIPLALYIFSALSLIYPRLSLTWLRRQDEDFARLLQHTIFVTFVFLVPAAIVLITLSVNVITLLFQRGAFGEEQTIAIAPLLSTYGIGLPAIGMTLLCGRVLVLMNRGWQFVALTMLSSLLIICIDIGAYQKYGVLGLSVGYSVGNWFQAAVSLIMIKWGLPTFRPWASLLRWMAVCLLVYCGVMAIMTPNLGWMGMLLSCAGVFAACLVLLFVFGERRIMYRDFWKIFLNHHISSIQNHE